MKIKWVLMVATTLGLLVVYPAKATDEPKEFPERVEKISTHQRVVVERRLSWVGQPLNFNETANRWSFTGIAEALVRFNMRNISVDLVLVRFPDEDGESSAAWVVAGVQYETGDSRYLPRGAWLDSGAAYQALILGETVMEVSIAGSPWVTREQIEWAACETAVCQVGAELAFHRFEISDSFIQSGGHAPGWYSWGFLFWNIQTRENVPVNGAYEVSQHPYWQVSTFIYDEGVFR
jgi:hypothetical protein